MESQLQNNLESIILEEEIDNYEPTEEEIHEYAGYLGMDIDNEKELFWIARNGLKAPLPQGWKPCQTKEEEIYYFNFETGESRWDHPCDEYFRKLYLEEKTKLYQKKVLNSFQLKDIAAEPITEDDFEDELETCERKRNGRKSNRIKDTTQRGLKEGDINKETIEKEQKKYDGKDQLITDLSQSKISRNILNESKLHLSKSPLSSSLCTSTIEDHSQLFYNNASVFKTQNQQQSGQKSQKFFNSIRKQLDDTKEQQSFVVSKDNSILQNDQLQQRKDQIYRDLQQQLSSINQKLENDLYNFQTELESNLEAKKSQFVQQFKDKVQQQNIQKENEQTSKKNKILEELQLFQNNELLRQQEQLQNHLSNLKQNCETNSKLFEEEVEQICLSRIEQIQSEISDLKQMKDEQQKGIQNIEQDHQEVIQTLQNDLEKQKIEINQKIQDQIKNALEKEQKNFESDLESFQIQEISKVEEEAYRQTVALELEKKFKDYQIDLQREQQNKRHLVFDRIRKEEVLNFEKNKMKKRQEYEQMLEQKKLDVQKLLSQHDFQFEKVQQTSFLQKIEMRSLENKQKDKYDQFMKTHATQLENKIIMLEKQKESLKEQIEQEEPVCSDINNLDLELHQVINEQQNKIDEVSTKKYKACEDFITLQRMMEDILKQKQEQEKAINDINLQILNQENINQQIAFNKRMQQRNLEEDKKAERKLRVTLEQFRSNNPNSNYFSGANCDNNIFQGEQNSFGYKIDESSILNNDDIHNHTEVEKLQREIEELKYIIQRGEILN